MDILIPQYRRPVGRDHASTYMLYTLLSFAISVSTTRLFLSLTGYPQLGKGEFHIAHVLWGGLLLFIASLLPVLLANRWAFTLDAILSGAGVGLFIDEVGKFITSTNNYFFPLAAPIIYAFFLLTVLLYLEVRKPRKLDTRSELYIILQDLEEVLDRDLSERERADILDRLNRIENETDYPDFAELIKQLKDFINHDSLYLIPHKPGILEKSRDKLKQLEKTRLVTHHDLQIGLTVCFLIMGLWSIRYPIQVLFSTLTPQQIQSIVNDLIQAGLIKSPFGLVWFEIRLGLQTAVGLLLLISAFLMGTGRDRRGIAFGYLALLISLITVNILMFYFNQFSTIITAFIQFVLLLVVVYYRRRYLQNRLI